MNGYTLAAVIAVSATTLLCALTWAAVRPPVEEEVTMARTEISDERRQAIANWLTANGVNPADVPLDSSIVVGPKAISYDAYLRNADGRRYLDPVTNDAARERRTVPLVTRRHLPNLAALDQPKEPTT